VIGFIVAIVGALWVARLVSFLLDEEVFPKLQMERGLPYLISTLLRYIILLCGFVFALAALGIDMTKFTILAGAFSVGLGFGLQNIVNNFVSGLIVLFERPMKIGDVVQVGDVLGQVERIGIRASVIRSSNGAEVIIPNGTLISTNLTNWTFSNKSRRVDVQVQVALGSDPERVKDLLLEAAKSHPGVSAEPQPQALLTKLGPDTLEFELRVWSDAASDWARVRSDLVSAIEVALKRDAINLK
jgi:potassium efflux system protein